MIVLYNIYKQTLCMEIYNDLILTRNNNIKNVLQGMSRV